MEQKEYFQYSHDIAFLWACVCKISQVAKTDRYGHNALFSAAMNGNLAVVKCLLEATGVHGAFFLFFFPTISGKQSFQQKAGRGGLMVESF